MTSSKFLKLKFLVFTFCLGLLFPSTVNSYFDLGNPKGFVTDLTKTLSQTELAFLENKLTSFEKESSNEIVVVLINSLENDSIENFAVKLFEDWKIGKRKNDNGVLLLIAKDDREVRIEVGYGLEGILTDAESNWLIQDVLIPNFKESKYYQGIDKATDKILLITKGEYLPEIKKETNKSSLDEGLINFLAFIFFTGLYSSALYLGKTKSWWLGGVIGCIIGLLVGIFLSSFLFGIILTIVLGIFGLIFDYIVSKSDKWNGKGGNGPGGFWGGGGFGGGTPGGFGGFGGGRSGGGGASGKW